jgi:hypothetical protein
MIRKPLASVAKPPLVRKLWGDRQHLKLQVSRRAISGCTCQSEKGVRFSFKDLKETQRRS